MGNYNSTEARWLQFKRFGEQRVLEIHALEAEAGCTSLDPRCTAATALIHRFNVELGPYWDKRKTDSEQDREVAAFRLHIRPIWNAAATEARAAGGSAIDALHAADLAIVRDPYKINCGAGSSIGSSPILKKVYERSGQDRASGADAD